MQSTSRKILAAAGLAVLLLALLALALWLARAPIAEALIRRTLERQGLEADFQVQKLGTRGAELTDIRIGPPRDSELTVESAVLDYTPGGLRAGRVESAALTGARIVVQLREDGSITAAGFPVGDTGGGAPPVSLGALTARDADLVVRSPAGELDGELDISGGQQQGWRGALSLGGGPVAWRDYAARVRQGEISFDWTDGALDAEGGLTLSALETPRGAAGAASLTLDAHLTEIAPDTPLQTLGTAALGLTVEDARAENPQLLANLLLRPQAWRDSPVAGALADPLTGRAADLLAGFDARASLTLDANEAGWTLEMDSPLRLTGEAGPDVTLSPSGQGPEFALARQGAWTASSGLAVTGGPELTAQPLQLSGGGGRALAQLDTVVTLAPMGEGAQLGAEALDVSWRSSPGGWRAGIGGAASYSGELASWAFGGLTASGAAVVTRAGEEITLKPSSPGGVLDLRTESLDGALALDGVEAAFSPSLTIALGRGPARWRLNALPDAPVSFSMAALDGGSWRLSDIAMRSAEGGMTIVGEGGQFRITQTPALSTDIGGAEGESWTLSGVSARPLTAASGNPLVRRDEDGIDVFLAFRDLGIASAALENGTVARDIKLPSATIAGALTPQTRLDIAAPGASLALDAVGREGLAVATGALQAEVSRLPWPIRIGFEAEEGSVSGGALPVRLDQTRLGGGLTLSDPLAADIDIANTRLSLDAERPAVRPVSASGDLTLEGGVLQAELTGSPDGAPSGSLQASLRHDLPDNEGEASLTIPEIAFELGGAQPQDFIPPLQGFVAQVEGPASGRFQAAWADGGLTRSGGVLDLTDVDMATRFGPLDGVTTQFRLSSLVPLLTDAPQTIRAESFNPGINLQDGFISIDLLEEGRIGFTDGGWPFAEGEISIEPFVWTPGAQRNEAVLTAEKLNLAALVGLFNNQALEAAGTVSGRVPVVIAENNVAVEDAKLTADEDGFFSYQGQVSKAAAQGGSQANLAFRALENFQFRVLEVTLDGPVTGEMDLGIQLEGFNPEVLNGYPFAFDIDLSADLVRLIRDTTQGFRIREQIEKKLQQESDALETEGPPADASAE